MSRHRQTPVRAQTWSAGRQILECPKCSNISINIRNEYVNKRPEATTAQCYNNSCGYTAHITEFLV